MAGRGALLLVGVLLIAGCARGAAPSSQPATAGGTAASPAGSPAGGGSGGTPAAPIAVRASYSALSMSQSPIAIAKDAGYYAEQGLDVEVIGIRSSAQNAAALLSGEVDVSIIGGIGPVRARLSGSDLLLIGATKPYFAGAIVARPDIHSAADLRGGRVGISAKGGNTDLMARAALPRLGLDPDVDVTLLSTGDSPEQVAALLAGNVDAASLTPPADEHANNAGYPTLYDITGARIPYPAVALGTSGPRLAERPDALERFLRAYGQAVHRYLTDKAYTLQVAADFLRSDDPSANDEAYEVERRIMQADLELPLSAIQSTLDLIKPDDPRAAEARPEEFVDLSLVHKLQQSGFFQQLAASTPTP
ncbi:MAG TPA: ABC transporter substrate-binding protein [Chloroflexota bacterium]|nr:ABC transporter substrate-binding protein [Chloroflexota bacterium]